MPGQVRKVVVLSTGGTVGMGVEDEGRVLTAAKFEQNFQQKLRERADFHQDSEGDSSDISATPLTFPRSHNNRKLQYWFENLPTLVKSCEMTVENWNEIARTMHKLLSKADGVVVLHGTDTMAYTASALSFMFSGLSQPIILTGASSPFFEPGSDGPLNLAGALQFAGFYAIPEVTIFYNQTLFRGNRKRIFCIRHSFISTITYHHHTLLFLTNANHPRAMKADCNSHAAFQSPNFPPLAEMRTGPILINNNRRLSLLEKPAQLHELKTDLGITLIQAFPGMTASFLEATLQPPTEAMLIRVFGCGNFPVSRPGFKEVFESARKRGILITTVTQCQRGGVTTFSETIKEQQELGIIPCGDMTTEAAYTKLYHVLTTCRSRDERVDMMTSSLRGEITVTS